MRNDGQSQSGQSGQSVTPLAYYNIDGNFSEENMTNLAYDSLKLSWRQYIIEQMCLEFNIPMTPHKTTVCPPHTLVFYYLSFWPQSKKDLCA